MIISFSPNNSGSVPENGYLEVFHTPLRWSITFGETDSVDYYSINEDPDKDSIKLKDIDVDDEVQDFSKCYTRDQQDFTD